MLILIFFYDSEYWSQTQIIATFIAGLFTLVASTIAILINWLTEKRHFKNDYLKFILAKKFKAYESLLDFTSKLRDIKYYDDDLEKKYHAIFEDWDIFIKYYEEMHVTVKEYAVWISPTSQTDLQSFIYFFTKNVYILKDTKPDIRQIGLENFDTLQNHRKSLIAILKKNMYLLYKLNVKHIKDF